MPATTADLAVKLPWLAPGEAALVALANAKHLGRASEIVTDPAAVALILRFSRSNSPAAPLDITTHERARLLRFARRRLVNRPIGIVRPNCVALAAKAFDLSGETGRIAAVLSDLGRMAIAAVESPSATDIEPGLFTPNSTSCERTTWGATAAEVTRRLARRWGLPTWCQDVLSQLARSEPVSDVGTPAESLASVVRLARRKTIARSPAAWTNPFGNKLLVALLRAAERSYRRDSEPLIRRLEAESDRLHAMLDEQLMSEADRLRERKLTAIAEFAAGAGHEINTPLAVISGQSQYLLSSECEPNRKKALQTIVVQAHRVHDILTDLMQFARPANADRQLLDLGMLMREVTTDLMDMASLKDVRLDVGTPESFLGIADPRHFRIALHCLLRNAIEAVPSGGWARVRGEIRANQVLVIVEDSGPGVDPAMVDHMFDPFYSGRAAGRGRGLGLSTAWRLARLQNGDVRYFAPNDGPTRFAMTLPRGDEKLTAERRSA